MTYILDVLKLSEDKMEEMLNYKYLADVNITSNDLISIDYKYHCNDENYDNGLSFIDRLHKKLSIYYTLDWEIGELKDYIYHARDEKHTYAYVVNEILTQEMINCYGV